MSSFEQYPSYAENGAGIIRLCEQWLDKITPMDIKNKYDVGVWIMSCLENNCNGNKDSLNKFMRLNADGVLL